MASIDQRVHVDHDLPMYLTYESVLFGIVVWDWLVCLASEYRHVWKAKHTVVRVLYIMSRYISLVLTTIVFTLNYLNQPLSTCNVLVRFNCAAITVIQAISLAVLAQRAYYVSLRSKAIFFFLSLFIVALLACGITHAAVAVESTPDIMVDGRGTCRVRMLSHWKGLSTAFFALPVVGHAVATAIIFWQARRHLTHNGSLRRLLVLDGLFYLLAVDAVGVVQLVFFTASDNHQLAMMNAAALLSLTSVFCCRFILHLRSKASDVSQPGTGADSWTNRPDWTNNFGAPLEGPKKMTGLKVVLRPKHRPTRLSDTGTVTIQSIPELRTHYVPPEKPLLHLDEIAVRQETVSKIDTMSDSISEAETSLNKA